MFLRWFFFFEVLLNAYVTVLCWFFPALLLELITGQRFSGMADELMRWYGVLLFVITTMLLLALLSRSFEALRIVLIAYGIGDLLQALATWHMADFLGGWGLGLYVSLFASLMLFIVRLLALRKPQWMGFANNDR